MAFQVRHEKRPNKFEVDDTVCVLDNGQGSFLEIAPALGFNAYRWHVPDGELLYADPKFFEENKPTRSGVPVLFPFPNRIRDGRFTWEGKDYQLPTNDPSGKNAIHGFVCHKPWRIVAEGADTGAAWVTAEFVASKDAPETLQLWPADYHIALTYRFQGHILDILAEIANPGARDLPWGLGYHPYFDLSLFGGAAANVTLPADQTWELVDCLPTGQRLPVDPQHDLRDGKSYEALQLDAVYTHLEEPAGMRSVGLISNGMRRLEMYVSDMFREVVAFTPPHRRAICLEPYTCVTDAINLQQQGIDAGWSVLKAGERCAALVSLSYKRPSYIRRR